MGKIYINLNPQKEKLINIIFYNLASYTHFVAFAAGFLLIVIFIFNAAVFFRGRVYSRYQRFWVEQKDKFDLLNEIKQERAVLSSQKEAFLAVTDVGYRADRMLDDIYSVLPNNIWFNKLDFKQGRIDLRGYVVQWQEDYLVSLVDNFVEPLKKKAEFSSNFKTVNIRNSKRVFFNGIEVLEFNLECLS